MAMHLRPQSSTTMIDTFQKEEWASRKIFMGQMARICQEEDIELHWLSHNWIAKLRKNKTACFIMGYVFPLNPASSASIARDKVATYEVLAAASIPAVVHRLIRFPGNRSTTEALEVIKGHYPFPFVLKPCSQSTGFDVYKIDSPEDLTEILTDMASRYQTVAISPLEQVLDEYRVVMLDDSPLLTFRKVRPTDAKGNPIEWRHNLSLGAQPQVAQPALQQEVAKLAKQVMSALHLRVGAIDIVTTPDGLKVMEINNGFSLSKTSQDPHFTQVTYQALKQIVQACFAS